MLLSNRPRVVKNWPSVKKLDDDVCYMCVKMMFII